MGGLRACHQTPGIYAADLGEYPIPKGEIRDCDGKGRLVWDAPRLNTDGMRTSSTPHLVRVKGKRQMEDELEGIVIDGMPQESPVEERKEEAEEKGEVAQEEPKGESVAQGKPEEGGEEPTKEEPPKEDDPKEEPKKEGEVEEDDDLSKVPTGVLKRFSKLTREKNELKSRLEFLEREYRKAQGQDEGKPATKEDFLAAGKTEDDFIDYLAGIKAEEAARRIAEEARVKEENKAIEEREESFRKQFPDYDIMKEEALKLPATSEINSFLRSSPYRPAIIHAIGKFRNLQKGYMEATDRLEFVKGIERNLKEVQGKPVPSEAKPAVASASAKPEQPAVAKTTVREPMNPEEGKRVARKMPDPSKCSMDEWMEWG